MFLGQRRSSSGSASEDPCGCIANESIVVDGLLFLGNFFLAGNPLTNKPKSNTCQAIGLSIIQTWPLTVLRKRTQHGSQTRFFGDKCFLYFVWSVTFAQELVLVAPRLGYSSPWFLAK